MCIRDSLIRGGHLANILMAGGELGFTLLSTLVAAVIWVVPTIPRVQPTVRLVPLEGTLYLRPVGELGPHAQGHSAGLAAGFGSRSIQVGQVVGAQDLIHADAGVAPSPVWFHL